MSLILDPSRYPTASLVTLRVTMVEGLREVAEDLDAPRGKVVDAAGLERARDLIRAAQDALSGEVPPDPERLAAEINLAYAATLAAVDLMKCHTDLPRVPRPRSTTST